MSKITIFRGWHYSMPPAIPSLVHVKKDESEYVAAKFMFTDSCMFDLYDEDQHDVNKLFGFSIGHHKKGSSFRFGWRPILKENLIEVVAYEYHDGVRQRTMPIRKVKLNAYYDYTLLYDSYNNKTHYHVNDVEFTNNVDIKKSYGWGYTLGTYFGGNEKAPHKIVVMRSNYDPN